MPLNKETKPTNQIHLYTNEQLYSKQFSLVWEHSIIIKNISISSNSI